MTLKFAVNPAIAGVAWFLTSCTTTREPYQVASGNQPHAVLTTKALVREPIPIAFSRLTVVQLDGKPPGDRRGDHFRLSPGQHVVQLRCVSGQSMAVVDLNFKAEAGQTYVARARRPQVDVRFWLENKATGEVVDSKMIPLRINPNAAPLVVPVIMPLR